MCMLLFFRGLEFRQDYKCICLLRAILPDKTPFLALTATASNSMIKEIVKDLKMQECKVIAKSPVKENFCYVSYLNFMDF